jgi:small redox-active disulfide protein 2
MEIKVLAGCCCSCGALYDHVLDAVSELGISAKVEMIDDPVEVASYGVIKTPGIVIDGRVVSFGKMLKHNEVKVLLEKAVK